MLGFHFERPIGLLVDGEESTEPMMNFLYLGQEQPRADGLSEQLARADIAVQRVPRPEAAFFKVLQEDVSAVFLDLADPDLVCGEVIGNLCSLDKQVEIVLIGDQAEVNQLDPDQLRACFGFISPRVEDPANAMVLHQLTFKLSMRARLAALKTNAIVDGLTQLYNHAFIQQQLEDEIAHMKESGDNLSIVMLDLDHFKHYNDTNGHPAGDEVLRKVAEILDGSVRKIDFAARYGGEEFLLIFPGANLWTCLLIAERVRRAIAHTEFTHGETQPLGFVSASFGAAMLDGDLVIDKQTLISVADQALYKAKHEERNCIWYFQNGDYHPYRPAGALQGQT